MSENEKDATSLKAIERERGKASVKALEQLLTPTASSMAYIDDDYILIFLQENWQLFRDKSEISKNEGEVERQDTARGRAERSTLIDGSEGCGCL